MSEEIKQVLWSGGLDSTYLIYKLLQDGYKVEAYYVQLENNPNKTKRELSAIKKLSKLFKEYNFEYKGILTHISIDLPQVAGFLQSPAWLFSAYYLKGPVNIGFVMNDDSISYLKEYYKIASLLSELRDGKLVLEFPLMKTAKSTIIQLLPKKFLDLITYCESEKVEDRCGKCHSCVIHNLATPIVEKEDIVITT